MPGENKQSGRMKRRTGALAGDAILFAAAERLFQYHDDGTLTFKIDPRHPDCPTSRMIGRRAGGDDGHGYLMCMLLGQKFKVHQIVWLLHHKQFPRLPIDHANRQRRDNRIENLRVATDVENQQNLVASTSPTAGTWRSPRSGRYAARFTYKGKKVYLGYFDTQAEANAAYRQAKRQIAQEFSPV